MMTSQQVSVISRPITIETPSYEYMTSYGLAVSAKLTSEQQFVAAFCRRQGVISRGLTFACAATTSLFTSASKISFDMI